MKFEYGFGFLDIEIYLNIYMGIIGEWKIIIIGNFWMIL